MKNFKSYLACLAVFALFLTSCSKDDPNQTDSDKVATITFSSLLVDANKALDKQSDALPGCSDEAPAFAEISLTYGPSNTEVNVIVPIMMDSDGYFTVYDEDLEIPVPADEDWVSISLNTFNVWSDNGAGAPGTVIWKAPMDGSEYASMVSDALPKLFDLRAGSKNYVDVEVLCFDDREVNKYGYQFFNIIPEELRELCFFVNYCSVAGRHYTADYELDLYYFTGDNTEVTPGLSDLEVLYSNRSPEPGLDGDDYYTDPLCLFIPEPQMGEGDSEAYLYYEVTLTAWEGNYTFPATPVVQTGFLSWSDIEDLLDTDGDGDIENNTDVDYWHVKLNCGTDDNGGGVDQDADNDGVTDAIDECDNTPSGATVNAVGCPSDSDGDGVLDGIDECPSVNPEVDVDNDGCEDSEGCSIGSPDTGCVVVYASGVDTWVTITEPDGFPDPFFLNELGAEQNFGSISAFIDGGDVVVQLSMDQGFDLDDYVVELSDDNDGTMDLCVDDSNVAPPTGDDPDATIVFGNATIIYPFYVRVKANVCPE